MKPENIWSDKQLGISSGGRNAPTANHMKTGRKVVIDDILEKEMGREVAAIA
ncbi:hypothetical protein L873DRAFT_1798600, partial [Choiromyces venosus 120613-1]